MVWGVVGSKGMLGRELSISLSQQGISRRVFHRGNLNFDLPAEALALLFDGIEVIVNAAAFTNVDLAETLTQQAQFANAVIPAKLAKVASLTGARLIQISTDYVFDGKSKSAYLPTSIPNPISVYGRTKLRGEQEVLAYENTQVVRTSWLYGAFADCFPKKISLKLAGGTPFSVVNDQFGTPTHAKELAKFVISLAAEHPEERVLHGVSSGSTTWFDFAREVAISMGLEPEKILSSKTMVDDGFASRPAMSVLTPSKLAGFEIPDWRVSWRAAADSVLG